MAVSSLLFSAKKTLDRLDLGDPIHARRIYSQRSCFSSSRGTRRRGGMRSFAYQKGVNPPLALSTARHTSFAPETGEGSAKRPTIFSQVAGRRPQSAGFLPAEAVDKSVSSLPHDAAARPACKRSVTLGGGLRRGDMTQRSVGSAQRPSETDGTPVHDLGVCHDLVASGILGVFACGYQGRPCSGPDRTRAGRV
jgi:hypothetical protein